METRAPYVMVGVFVLLLIGGLVFAVLWFAEVQFRETVNYYDIFFSGSVTGLTTGSTVRYNGIPVGRVSEIKLDPIDPTKVRVTAELQGAVEIKTDTVASIELEGLAGGSYINLGGGTRDAANLARKEGERYPVIQSKQSGLQQVVANAPQALQKLIDLTGQLGQVLSQENRDNLAKTLANLERVTSVPANRSEQIDSTITDAADMMHQLRGTVDQLNALLASLKEATGPKGELHETLTAAADAANNVGALAKRADDILAANQPQLRDFSQGGLAQIPALVQQTQALVQQLSRIADSIERDPSRIIYGDQRRGYQPK